MKSIFFFLCIFGFHASTLFGFDYGGFHLNDTIFQYDPEHEEILRTIFQKQVDVVNAVQLPPCLSTLIHHIPITAVIDYNPPLLGNHINDKFAARYIPLIAFVGSCIQLNAILGFSHFNSKIGETALLHEFMHAIHDIYVPGSLMNSEIIKFYSDAKERHCYGYTEELKSYSTIYSTRPYPYQEYLFTNYLEFFACTAATYLYGKNDLQPFSRKEIQEQQPEYYAFLQKFFDPDSDPENSRFNSINNWYNLESSTY